MTKTTPGLEEWSPKLLDLLVEEQSVSPECKEDLNHLRTLYNNPDCLSKHRLLAHKNAISSAWGRRKYQGPTVGKRYKSDVSDWELLEHSLKMVIKDILENPSSVSYTHLTLPTILLV